MRKLFLSLAVVLFLVVPVRAELLGEDGETYISSSSRILYIVVGTGGTEGQALDKILKERGFVHVRAVPKSFALEEMRPFCVIQLPYLLTGVSRGEWSHNRCRRDTPVGAVGSEGGTSIKYGPYFLRGVVRMIDEEEAQSAPTSP